MIAHVRTKLADTYPRVCTYHHEEIGVDGIVSPSYHNRTLLGHEAKVLEPVYSLSNMHCMVSSVPRGQTTSSQMYKVNVRLGCKKHIGSKQRDLDDPLADACRTFNVSTLSITRNGRYINVSMASSNVPLSHIRRNVTYPNPNPFDALHLSELCWATGTTFGDSLARLHVLSVSSG